MPDDFNASDEKKLPWPEETDPATLGTEFADPHRVDDRKLANAFADPNSLDDARLGSSFAETNSSAKKHHAPLRERVHKPAERKWLVRGLIVAAILFLAALLLGGLPRYFRERDLKKESEKRKDAKPVVEAARVQRAKDGAGLVEPGTTIPLTEAYVYARANGYLKVRLVDIGDHVRKGQLLAIIEAPDLDAQVEQAREQLRQAEQQLDNQKSQLALQKVTVERYRVLVTKGVLSRQQGDQQETNYATQVANVAAADRNVQAFRANLEHQIALQSYEQVRAPFTGVVTQRNVDVGALISASGTSSGEQSGPAPTGQFSTTGGTQQAAQSNNAGSSGNTGTAATPAQSPGQGGPLFGIADVSRLRILVSVPEGYATAIHPGQQAQLAVQELPSATFTGDITRTSDSIDPNTRTLLTEIQVDNRDGKLMPGMYTVVTFPPAPGVQGPLVISGDAVAVRNNTTTVAAVVDGRIRYVPVTLGRDFGDVVEITNGLRAGDIVVTDVTDDVTPNREVQVHMKGEQSQQPTAAPNQNQPLGGSTQYSNEGITDQNLQGKQSQQNQKSQGKGAQKGNSDQNRTKSESKP
jgi:multidrug efflux pump subunit AcrA (membrane-fusion protein)